MTSKDKVYNSNPCGCPYEVVVVTHKYEIHGVSAVGKLTECTRCRTQWMTQRQESELDGAVQRELASALESANAEIAGNYKVHESLTRCIEIMEDKNKKLTDEIERLKQDLVDLKPWPDDYRELVTQNEALRKENDTLIHNSELEAAAHMDTLAKLEKSIAALQVQTEQATILARIDNKYVEALNKIGMLGMSEHAYTSEFTERVRSIITEALK